MACASDRLQVAPCTIEGVGAARCGTLRVPDLALHFVVVPAKEAATADPIFILQGGPGQAASKLADFYAQTFDEARARRDIVLLDQRGTGGSHPLDCDLGESLDLFPIDAIERCRADLARTSDLARFKTANAIDDLEALRRALGYSRVNLYGTSYGTRVAMQYAARFPRNVRSMILKGVVSPESVIPVGFAENSERAIRLLIDDCAADAGCAAKFPQLARDYATMRAALPHGELTPGRVGAVLRTLLQSTGSSKSIPRLIHTAASGDWSPLETTVRSTRAASARALSTGMTLSVVCAEDAASVKRGGEEGTLLGSYWIDQVLAACRVWNVPAVQLPPVGTITVPALLVSGYLDPATPPSMAEEAMRHLAASRHLIVRNGSHSFSGLAGCVDRIMSAFVERGSADGLDFSCAERIRRPEWE